MPRPPKDEPTFQPAPLAPLFGITRANYAERAHAFIETNGGKTFLVCSETRKLQGEEFPATPAQWEAWLSFFERKRIKHTSMSERGYYTVPTEWPSAFATD